jgi:hypothetical protein
LAFFYQHRMKEKGTNIGIYMVFFHKQITFFFLTDVKGQI